jgi:hypothetical protein
VYVAGDIGGRRGRRPPNVLRASIKRVTEAEPSCVGDGNLLHSQEKDIPCQLLVTSASAPRTAWPCDGIDDYALALARMTTSNFSTSDSRHVRQSVPTDSRADSSWLPLADFGAVNGWHD